MRKVTWGAACSLDGFIAGPENALDWLHTSRDVQRVMADYWSRVDAVLMGRRTWEIAAASQASGGGGGMSGMTAYVFSRTLREAPAGAELVRDDAGDFVRRLRQRAGREICVLGGSLLATALFRAGVIDEVGVNIHPVLLGSGTPFFRDAGRIRLTLLENRTIDGGCVLATFRVNRRQPRRTG